MNETMCNIRDLATAILKHPKCWPARGTSNLKLHALCYLAQGWALAWSGQPLTDEIFVAGRQGPVSLPLLQASPQHALSITADDIDAPGLPMPKRHHLIIDSIMATYGSHPFAGGLERVVCHERGPWAQARHSLTEPEAPTHVVINTDSMRIWFTALDLVS